MSVTVNDIMRLPCMNGAKVIAGEGGLTKALSSVSVLEFSDANDLQREILSNIEFYGNELVITAFAHIRDNVEQQCANIKRLATAGECGLILYYVGIFMPRVDQRLIDLADELDFTLIVMPENRMDLRYSEVICEVMELIHRDQMSGTSLVSELLEQAAGLPVHQRTVDSMLRMLADRLRASVVLMDSSRRVLNEAPWPRAFDNAMKEELTAAEFPELNTWKYHAGLNIHIYRDSIQTQEGHSMDLLIFREGDIPDVVITRQAVEVVQLAVSMWSEKHDRIVIGELVRAILQDEPMKMRRLADIFNVDVASINSMWLICGEKETDQDRLAEIVEIIRRDTEVYSATAIADIYDDVLVLFMIGPGSIQDVRALTEAIGNELAEHGIKATLTRCHALNTTTRVRDAFLSHQAGLVSARKIFPNRWVYTLEQINFAQQCQEIIGRGERAVNEALRSIEALMHENDETNLMGTLECYLLDAQMSVTQAAEKMFLHKNTIKYRIQRIADQLGFVPGSFPESMPLFTACALNRLLRHQ